MSKTKTSGKNSSAPKKTKVEKTETGKKEAAETPKTTDTGSTGKAGAAPKSASQLSTSHFSSVSTPAYKDGWDSIFGGPKTKQKSTSPADNAEELPDRLTIADGDIDNELRSALYKAFQRQARNQGFSLAKIKKLADLEYSLDCNINKK